MGGVKTMFCAWNLNPAHFQQTSVHVLPQFLPCAGIWNFSVAKSRLNTYKVHIFRLEFLMIFFDIIGALSGELVLSRMSPLVFRMDRLSVGQTGLWKESVRISDGVISNRAAIGDTNTVQLRHLIYNTDFSILHNNETRLNTPQIHTHPYSQ